MVVTTTRATTTEQDLIRAYSRMCRFERCVCGGWVAPDDENPRAIYEAQQIHNASALHRSWRAWREAPQ